MGDLFDPKQADGYVAWQLHGRIGKTVRHIVGTRVPARISFESVDLFRSLLETKLDPYDAVLTMQTMVKTRDLVIFVSVPVTTSEEKFSELVDAFKDALRNARIIFRPLDCPIKPNLRLVQ